MALSLQPTNSKTTILDLNDDCLKEVFAHMDSETLTTAADVCTRFKQNTMHAALLTIGEISLFGVECLLGEDPLVYKFSMLRNFGQFIVDIYVDSQFNRDVEKRIIQYMSLYCVGKPIELHWDESRITEEIATLARPLLGRVQKLRFDSCRLDEVLLRNLPIWSAELQESEYGVIASKPVNVPEKQFDHLPQRNLKSISFYDMPAVKNAHIEELLQQNPQLKEVELYNCPSLDNCVLESIARNVPGVEKIGFLTFERHPSNRDYIKYFLQLHELKSITMGVRDDDSYVQSVVYEIASVNTGLDYLDLSFIDLRHNANQFIEGILKLQELKTLKLNSVTNFTAAHLIEICKHVKELSVIYFGSINTTITNDDLLDIVKNARKLEKFKCYCPRSSDGIQTNIDGNLFLKLAKLADQRNEKTNLCVELPRYVFTLTIPADLLAAVNNLKIKLW